MTSSTSAPLSGRVTPASGSGSEGIEIKGDKPEEEKPVVPAATPTQRSTQKKVRKHKPPPPPPQPSMPPLGQQGSVIKTSPSSTHSKDQKKPVRMGGAESGILAELRQKKAFSPVASMPQASTPAAAKDPEVSTPAIALKSKGHLQTLSGVHQVVTVPSSASEALSTIDVIVPLEILDMLKNASQIEFNLKEPSLRDAIKAKFGDRGLGFLDQQYGNKPFVVQKGEIPGQIFYTLPKKWGEPLPITCVFESAPPLAICSQENIGESAQKTLTEIPADPDTVLSEVERSVDEEPPKAEESSHKPSNRLKLAGMYLGGAVVFTLSQLDTIAKMAAMSLSLGSRTFEGVPPMGLKFNTQVLDVASGIPESPTVDISTQVGYASIFAVAMAIFGLGVVALKVKINADTRAYLSSPSVVRERSAKVEVLNKLEESNAKWAEGSAKEDYFTALDTIKSKYISSFGITTKSVGSLNDENCKNMKRHFLTLHVNSGKFLSRK